MVYAPKTGFTMVRASAAASSSVIEGLTGAVETDASNVEGVSCGKPNANLNAPDTQATVACVLCGDFHLIDGGFLEWRASVRRRAAKPYLQYEFSARAQTMKRSLSCKLPDARKTRKFLVERNKFFGANPARCRNDHQIGYSITLLVAEIDDMLQFFLHLYNQLFR